MSYMIRVQEPGKPEKRFECFELQPGAIHQGRIHTLTLVSVTSMQGKLCAVDELAIKVHDGTDIEIKPSLI